MSAPVNEGRRLSAAQAGVWYAQRLHPESPVFNLGGHLEIRGPLDADLLGAALARVVAEDDTLGLRFREVDGVPEQSFGPVAGTPPEFIDVSAEPDPAEAARHLMRVDLDTPRDLETGPLFGNLIFRLGPELHLWYLRAHHLIHDGYTTGLFCRRVAAVYTELATGHPAGRAFGSFARLLDGEDDYFGSAARQRDAGYWHKLMDGAPHPAGPVSARAPELRIVRETTHMPAEGFAALRRFADSAGVGWPQAVLCAAVLHRHLWTGETDVLLSLALPGRLTRNVPGMTANVLPLRCAVDRDATCAELARRVAGLAAAAQWHQRYGSADLMNDLGWPAQGRRQFGPMVNIMADDEVLSFAGTPARIRMMSTGGTADDLSLTFTREDGGLRIDATIDAAYTDCTDLTGYRRTFLQTVTAMTVGDGVLAGDVEALAPGECERVVETWNATGDGSAAEHSLGALFEGQAEVRPGAVALVSGAQRLTYGELNIRANRLARLLLSRGVRRGGVVGVLLERGLDFAVALVGVVKTGAAYVVLDPDFPDERLDLVARGAGVSVTVTGTEFAGRVTGPVVLADAVDTGGLPGDDLDLHVAPGDVACVMFTSGSTGRPKGVAAPHRALVGSLAGQQYATFGPGEVFLQCSPVSWDGFSLEFWGALLF
ncbi:MAG: AMP-binding protein, partial [Streptosporangiaceae bacterium]